MLATSQPHVHFLVDMILPTDRISLVALDDLEEGGFVRTLGSTSVRVANDEGSLRTRLGQSDLEKGRRKSIWPL